MSKVVATDEEARVNALLRTSCVDQILWNSVILFI